MTDAHPWLSVVSTTVFHPFQKPSWKHQSSRAKSGLLTNILTPDRPVSIGTSHPASNSEQPQFQYHPAGFKPGPKLLFHPSASGGTRASSTGFPPNKVPGTHCRYPGCGGWQGVRAGPGMASLLQDTQAPKKSDPPLGPRTHTRTILKHQLHLILESLVHRYRLRFR